MRGQRKVPYGFWTKERIKEASLKYTYRKEFERAEPPAYRQAQRLKILDTVCRHLKITRVSPINMTSSKDEEQKAAQTAKDVVNKVEHYHGCFYGDCPHEDFKQCLREVAEHCSVKSYNRGRAEEREEMEKRSAVEFEEVFSKLFDGIRNTRVREEALKLWQAALASQPIEVLVPKEKKYRASHSDNARCLQCYLDGRAGLSREYRELNAGNPRIVFKEGDGGLGNDNI